MTFTWLTRMQGARFRSGGKEYTEAEAADLIRDKPFAAANRHGDIIASGDLAKVARYGEPWTGAELAARLRGDSRG
jgi:hypothetical protein